MKPPAHMAYAAMFPPQAAKEYKLHPVEHEFPALPGTPGNLEAAQETALAIEEEESKLEEVERHWQALDAAMEQRAASHKTRIENLRLGLRDWLLAREEGHRKLMCGGRTYYIQKGRESVAIADEAQAVAELEALGVDGQECVAIKKAVKKADLLRLLKSPDGPKLEFASVEVGDPTLAVRTMGQ